MVIWLTGLSGAGKTSIGRQVYALWKEIAPNTVIVDGDVVLRLLRVPPGEEAYTLEGRRVVAKAISDICAWLNSQEINVVCCTMSLFPEIQRRNRESLSDYFEVYVQVPMEVVCRRDTKDLYGPAQRGEVKNVIGVDLPFVPPEAPDLVVDNSEDRDDFEPLAKDILRQALAR